MASMWATFVGNDFPNLGFAALDDEHQQISGLLNELHDAILQSVPVSERRFLLHQFEVYLRMNCRGEEQMMEHDRYPHTLIHRHSHEELYRKLHNFDRILIEAGREDAIQELRSIRQVLVEHVGEEDARIANWHRVHGISPDSPD
jgi:hemerythrin-like metal-binding protein